MASSGGFNGKPPPPITVFPNDTIVIHYEPLELNGGGATVPRNSRSTIPGAGTIEARLQALFDSRCLSFDARSLIVDLLKAPLRVRAEIVQRLEEDRRQKKKGNAAKQQPNNDR